MAQQELIIDYDYYEREQCSFDDLKEALLQLTNASQDQFEQIKKEKWFTRVFDMVTFSKKNEKRMASQISNLAQAQQIMMDILVRLSERDKRVSDLVTELYQKIERLSRNDVLLAKRVNQLENRVILGITKESDLADLSELERRILSGVFFSLMERFNYISDEQREFANNVLKYLDVHAQAIDLHASLSSISHIEVKRKILTASLEYCFLNEFHFDLPDRVEEIIDEFDFGNKTVTEVKSKITALYNLRGVGGFMDKYGKVDGYEESFYIEMPEDSFEEEAVELEEIYIDSILHIPHGQNRVFKNNIVHIRAYINCEGHLEFNNCVIYYNESEVSDEITLSEGANIVFSNCEVNCLGLDKNFFVQAKGQNEIILSNNVFNHCSHFLSLNGESLLQVKNCIILTPGESFVKSTGWGNSITGEISDTKIDFKRNESDSDPEQLFIPMNDEIFSIEGTLLINNCEINGIGEFDRKKMASVVFNISGGNYKNCSFKNMNKCIRRGASISECSFDFCSEVIESNYFVDSTLEINYCLFTNCEDIFNGDHLSIKNSQFVDCRNRIVEGEDITIEFCEFYNLVNDLSGFIPSSSFEFRCGKNTATNTISKCLFDGVEIGKGFLIQGSTYEKISGTKVYVKDCDFRNCTTERPTNIIVREYNYYFGLFNRKVETKPVSISNCRGLDKVNAGKSRADEFIIRSTTPTGVKIGVAVAGVVAGLPGLVVGMGIAKLLKDDDLRQE